MDFGYSGDRNAGIVILPWPKINDLDRLISDEFFRSEAKGFLERFYEPQFKMFGPQSDHPFNYIWLFESYKRFLTDLTVGNTVYVSRRMPKIPEKPDDSLVYAIDEIGHELSQMAFSETFITDVLRKMASEYLETVPGDSEDYTQSEHLLETPFVTSPAPDNRRQLIITTYEEIENGSPLPPVVEMIYLYMDYYTDFESGGSYIKFIIPMLEVLDALPRQHIKRILFDKETCEYLIRMNIGKEDGLDLLYHESWPYLRSIFYRMQAQDDNR